MSGFGVISGMAALAVAYSCGPAQLVTAVKVSYNLAQLARIAILRRQAVPGTTDVDEEVPLEGRKIAQLDYDAEWYAADSKFHLKAAIPVLGMVFAIGEKYPAKLR